MRNALNSEPQPSFTLELDDQESLKKVQDVITAIRGVLSENQSMKNEDLDYLKTILQSTKVIGTTVSKLLELPELKHNVRILQNILDGKLSGYDTLLFLPPQVAQILTAKMVESYHQSIKSGNTICCNWLTLNKLTSISLETSKVLISESELIAELDGLQEISDELAQELAKYSGHLSLKGLQSMTDHSAQSFAKHTGSLGLNKNIQISPATRTLLNNSKQCKKEVTFKDS